MFNALVSLILFCTFWCKLYNLGIQVERQDIKPKSENKETVRSDIELPVLTFQNKATWRAQEDNVANGLKESSSQATNGIKVSKERVKPPNSKVYPSAPSKDIYKKNKPQNPRRKHLIVSTENKKSNDTTPLSKRVRNILEALEEKDEAPTLESSLVSKTGDSSSNVEKDKEETVNDERKRPESSTGVKVTPPAFNKRRRLVISDQRGLSLLTEPSVLSQHIYEKRMSTLYQRFDEEKESTRAENMCQKPESNVSKQPSLPSSSVVVDQTTFSTSATEANTKNTGNTLPLQPHSQVTFESPSGGLASIAFQAGQVSEWYWKLFFYCHLLCFLGLTQQFETKKNPTSSLKNKKFLW